MGRTMVEIGTGLGVPLIDLTPIGLILLVVLFLMTGVIIPRRTYKDLLKDRDNWRDAHDISEKERIRQARQVDTLLEVGRTVEQVLNALPRSDREGDGT